MVWVDDVLYVGGNYILLIVLLLFLVFGPLCLGWCSALNVVLESIFGLLLWMICGLVVLWMGVVEEVVDMFVGCGEGLMLVGDDVLVGYVVWCCVLVLLFVEGCVLLIGFVYFCCVECGELFELVVCVVVVIRVGDE